MSIRISSRKKSSSNPIVIKPSRPRYSSDDDDEDKDVSNAGEEAESSWKQADSKKDDYEDEDYNDGNNNETSDYPKDDLNRNEDNDDGDEEVYQNGDTEVVQNPVSDKKNPPAAPPKPAAKVSIPPSKVAPALLHKREKQWPPPAPKTYDAFAVEGHGRMNPYTKELIKDEEEKEEEEVDKRCEIDDGHTAPVRHLRKNWQGRNEGPRLGVQRPSASFKGESEWIKHIKPEIEYEEPPKEPEWLQLVRNRRWNSTVKARFPCKTDDIVEFERRSTTPKNWKRLLLDKKAVRTIGQITGIGAEGEELLWRLAKQRGKIEDTKEISIPSEKDILAYEYVKGNLEAAVAEAAIQAIEGSEAGENDESVTDEPVKPTSRDRKASSSSTQVSAATIRQRLLRLHPEEFKKLLALDRARDAHLRWQFSTDPYDSVHEHQLQPFEIALLAGERESRLRYLLKKLLRPEDMPMSSHSSGTSTPVFGKPRGRSLPGSSYTSDQESDSGSSISSQRRSRGKKKPPVPLPRKGRSISPSVRDKEDEDVVHGFLGPEDEQIASELKRLEDLAKGIGLPKEISDLLKESAGLPTRSKERPEDSISMGLGDRMRNFPREPEKKSVVSSQSEKEVPSAEIKRSLEDRKLSFFGQAEKAKSYKKKESEVDDTDGGKASEIDMDEISSRRKKFLSQEKEAQTVSKVPEKSKTRHKVQRIKSDAELYAVLSKRRMATDDEDTAAEEPSSEMKGIFDDINNTFGGGEKQPSKGRRKPRYQESEDSESNAIEEKDEKEEEDDVEDEEEAPRRRSRRVAKADSGRPTRQRARKWSESEDSEEEEDGR